MRKIIQLRGLLVQHHLIIEGDDVHLIDSGFFDGIARIKKALAQHGLPLSNIRSLVFTHGHLDHTLNALVPQKLTGCKIYAPLLDRDHVKGRHRYRGWSRVCGWLEKLGGSKNQAIFFSASNRRRWTTGVARATPSPDLRSSASRATKS